jgi:hypothetical protein
MVRTTWPRGHHFRGTPHAVRRSLRWCEVIVIGGHDRDRRGR